MDEDKAEQIFNSALYQASNVVVICDMAISSLLKRKYRELFAEDASRKDFKELIIALKGKVKIPYEKDIRRIRALRNEYSHEYRQVNPDDVRFSNNAEVHQRVQIAFLNPCVPLLQVAISSSV